MKAGETQGRGNHLCMHDDGDMRVMKSETEENAGNRGASVAPWASLSDAALRCSRLVGLHDRDAAASASAALNEVLMRRAHPEHARRSSDAARERCRQVCTEAAEEAARASRGLGEADPDLVEACLRHCELACATVDEATALLVRRATILGEAVDRMLTPGGASRPEDATTAPERALRGEALARVERAARARMGQCEGALAAALAALDASALGVERRLRRPQTYGGRTVAGAMRRATLAARAAVERTDPLCCCLKLRGPLGRLERERRR